jgi:mannose-6-phosphate isomerase-like protein (cupin superfamily)
MKMFSLTGAFLAGCLCTAFLVAFSRDHQQGYFVEHEKDIASPGPGPHDGGGQTIAYPFFSHVAGLQLVFRKRLLKAGSSIGYHLQETDEIYYILQGRGEMNMNGKRFAVAAGDAILTRAGNSHGLTPVGDSMAILINYIQ